MLQWGMLGPGGEPLLCKLRDHLVQDEWGFTRQRTAGIPRQREERWEESSRSVPDESDRTGLGEGGNWARLSLTGPSFLFQPLLPFAPFPQHPCAVGRYSFPQQAPSSSHVLHRQQPSAQHTHPSRPSPDPRLSSLSSEPHRRSLGTPSQVQQGDLGVF